MIEIYPLVVAKRPLTNEEIDSIDNALTKLSYLFFEAKPFINEKSDGYQVSYEFVSEYLNVVRSILASSHFDFARNHLYALGEICTTCHTQDTTLRTLFAGAKRDRFNDDYAYAEFNYMTRNYRDAIIYYDKHLTSATRKTELEIIQPLQRIITIYTQINSNPADGVVKLKTYLNLKDHTPETKTQLTDWIRGMEELNTGRVSNIKSMTFDELKSFTYKYLGDLDKVTITINSDSSQEVQRVWLRGQLYHYLNNNPGANEIPAILYWLSVADRSIAYNFYFSMTDLYLKQCVLKYPEHKYAHRCYKEFREYVDYTYSRQGEPIPDSIRQELRELKMKLAR